MVVEGSVTYENQDIIFPRENSKQNILNDKSIIGVGCTAHSTIIQMNNGALYTWGWPSSGLLGKKDTRIPGISKVEGMNSVRTFYAGECNVFAIVGADDGNLHGLKFRCLLNDESFSDIKLQMHDSCLHLHSFILERRCPAFLAAFEEIKSDSRKTIYTANFDTKKDTILYCAILDYVYTDHCTIQKHLIADLASLALKLDLKHLYARCMGMSDMKVEEQIQDSSILGGNRRSLLDSIRDFKKENLKQRRFSYNRAQHDFLHNTGKKGGNDNTKNANSGHLHEFGSVSESRHKKTAIEEGITTKYTKSSFTNDFHSMLLHTENNKFDVFFQCKNTVQIPMDRNAIAPNVKPVIIGAHRAVVTTIPFFRSLLLGGFSESSTSGEINIDCPSNIFRSILGWIYSGSEDVINESNALGVLMYSKRFVLEELTQICEIFVIDNLDDDNAKYLKEFAERNDFPRLLRQSISKMYGKMTETPANKCEKTQ